MKTMTIVGWVSLAIYAIIAAGMYIPHRNVSGDRGVGLIIPVMMGMAVAVFAVALGIAQYFESTVGVGVLALLVAVPLVVVVPVTGINVLSSLADDRAERLLGSFRDPLMSEMGVAIKEGEPDKLKSLLTGKPQIDWSARDKTGFTLFGIALWQARQLNLFSVKGRECLRILVDAGARFHDDALGQGRHVMPEIVTGSDAELLELVLRAGGDPNSNDTLRRPALIGDFMEVDKARLLLNAGAEVRSLRVKEGDSKDYDALMYAASRARWELALLYLKHGCDPAYQTARGESAMTVAQGKAEDVNDGGGQNNRDGFLRALTAAKAKRK